MLTPLDIENREFKRTLGGYNRDDVEDFMSVILIDYEKLYKECNANRETIGQLNAQIEEYKSKEATLHSTLMTAQQMADSVRTNASEQGDLILQEARAKANQIIREANEEIKKLEAKYRELNQQIESYKLRVAAIIKSQLDILNDLRPDVPAPAASITSSAPVDASDDDVKLYTFDDENQ